MWRFSRSNRRTMQCTRRILLENLLQANPDQKWFPKECRNCLVHKSMRFNKVDMDVRQCSRVIDTLSWSRFGDFDGLYWKPVCIHGLLFFEVTIKCCKNIPHPKSADSRASNRVDRSCKYSIQQLLTLTSVSSFNDRTHGFWIETKNNSGCKFYSLENN